MADIDINTDHGAIEIQVDLLKAKSGNEALKGAKEKAEAEARSQGRKLGSGYGTRRDGDVLTVVFPLQAE